MQHPFAAQQLWGAGPYHPPTSPHSIFCAETLTHAPFIYAHTPTTHRRAISRGGQGRAAKGFERKGSRSPPRRPPFQGEPRWVAEEEGGSRGG